MNQNDNACGAISSTAGQDRPAAALMPIMAVVFIAYPIIATAMPCPLHVHLDLRLGDFASGLVSGSQFAAPLFSRMWAGDWLRFISPARWSCLAAPSSPYACSMRRRPDKACPPFRVTDRRSSMKLQTAAIALLVLMAMPSARAEETIAMTGAKPMLTYEDVRKVAPALEVWTQNRLVGEVWKRPGLAPRDRSIVTLAALIARNQTIEMPYHSIWRWRTASSRARFRKLSHISPSTPAGPMRCRRSLSPGMSLPRTTSAPISFLPLP